MEQKLQMELVLMRLAQTAAVVEEPTLMGKPRILVADIQVIAPQNQVEALTLMELVIMGITAMALVVMGQTVMEQIATELLPN